MDRIEASPWTLARGAFSVFALAVVLKEAPWRYVPPPREAPRQFVVVSDHPTKESRDV